MKFRSLSKSLLCLAFALVSAAAWNLHVIGAHHEAGDNDCQVCAAASAPQLNADCGTALLSRPENFSLQEPEARPQAAAPAAVPVFYGRAPPAA